MAIQGNPSNCYLNNTELIVEIFQSYPMHFQIGFAPAQTKEERIAGYTLVYNPLLTQAFNYQILLYFFNGMVAHH